METIKVRNGTKQGYIECPAGGVLNIALPNSKTRRGRVIENGTIAPTLDTGCEVGVVVEVKQIGQLYGTDREPNPKAGRIYDEGGLSPTLGANSGGNCMPMIMETAPNNPRIRKLTPKECFRLQGWSDDYFEKAEFVNSDSQLYKQAGNGVTVNVIYEIGKRLEI